MQFMQVYALFNDFFSENYNVPCKYRSFSYVEILANWFSLNLNKQNKSVVDLVSTSIIHVHAGQQFLKQISIVKSTLTLLANDKKSFSFLYHLKPTWFS